MPPGRSACAPARRIAACRRASRSGSPAGLRQRASGPRGERPEVRARRVDEHAVVGLRLLRDGGVGDAHLDAGRAHARGRALERPRAPGMALDRDDAPRGRPSAPRGGSSCRPAPRTGRARARPARGASACETAIAARDCGMKRPSTHSGEPKASNGASSTSPSGIPAAGWLGTGSAAASSAGVVRRALARSADSAAWLPAAISARASAGAQRLEPQRRDPLGIRVAQRGLRRAWPPGARRRARAPRAPHAAAPR